jgi:hypothetical protein
MKDKSQLTDRGFVLFENRLVLAVRAAKSTPEPTKEIRTKTLRVLKAGLRNGQQRIVVQVYNSVLRSIDSDKKYIEMGQ